MKRHCWSVSFGSAFSRPGVIGPVIFINTLVWGMLSEFLLFGAVDYFFKLRRPAIFENFRGIAKQFGSLTEYISACVVLKTLSVWICWLLLWSCEHWKQWGRRSKHVSFSCSNFLSREGQGCIYPLIHNSSHLFLFDAALSHIRKRESCLFWFHGC